MEFIRMTAKQYRDTLLKPVKPSKFGNTKTEYGGFIYDSKKEASRAERLEHYQRIGVIKNLRKQVSFELQPAYTTRDGRKIRAVAYVADFVYERDGETIVEDVKGMQTPVFKLKRKMFEYKYPSLTFVLT